MEIQVIIYEYFIQIDVIQNQTLPEYTVFATGWNYAFKNHLRPTAND